MRLENLIIEARKVAKRFGGVAALDGADFQCPRGKIVGLLGENGSGKTTLSRILAGYYRQSSGTVLYRGKAVSFASPREAIRSGIGMVHQNFSLVPDMTVWENIYLGVEPLRRWGMINDRQIKRDLQLHLRRLCPWIRPEQKVASLPPAGLQLVEIVKAFSRSPAFLILDEPTSSLERQQVESLFSLMKEMKQSGMSMVFISHRIQEVEQICDSIAVLRNGSTAGTVDLSGGRAAEYGTIVRLITGNKEVLPGAKREAKKDRPVFLQAWDISDARTLHHVSLTIHEGEIVGLAGLQGQGQEELIMSLAGFRGLTSGRIELRSVPVPAWSARQAVAAGIFVVPGNRQTEGLFMDRPAFFNVTFPQATLPRSPIIISNKKEQEVSSHLVADMSIKVSSLCTPVTSLSGGNAQKVVVSKWMPLNPKLLLMADPAKGIDVQSKAELYQIIVGLAERGTSFLLYASDLRELVACCDRILILYEGSIVEVVDNVNLDEETLLSKCMHRRVIRQPEPT